jgi:FkbM family methyltransferase
LEYIPVTANIKMRILLAKTLRFLFKSKYLKSKFFGVHKRIIKPFDLLKEVVLRVRFNDQFLVLHIDDWIQENIFLLGEYERSELKTLDKFLNKDSIFIDVGANIGLYTLCASKLIGENGKVFCFEPYSENFNSLTNNIAINNLLNVQAEKLAVGEKEGSIKLYYDTREKNLGMVSSNYIEDSFSEEVKMVSLDSYLQNKPFDRIDFIKIDIEGSEYSALLGMQNILTTYYPSLLIEILDNNELSDNSARINAYLEKLGYRKYFIDNHGNLSDIEVNTERRNYIFTTNALLSTK